MSINLFQQQKDEELAESEGVKCFTCGLEEINPHADKVTRISLMVVTSQTEMRIFLSQHVGVYNFWKLCRPL